MEQKHAVDRVAWFGIGGKHEGWWRNTSTQDCVFTIYMGIIPDSPISVDETGYLQTLPVVAITDYL